MKGKSVPSEGTRNNRGNRALLWEVYLFMKDQERVVEFSDQMVHR
jgi:hypothetical protein